MCWKGGMQIMCYLLHGIGLSILGNLATTLLFFLTMLFIRFLDFVFDVMQDFMNLSQMRMLWLVCESELSSLGNLVAWRNWRSLDVHDCFWWRKKWITRQPFYMFQEMLVRRYYVMYDVEPETAIILASWRKRLIFLFFSSTFSAKLVLRHGNATRYTNLIGSWAIHSAHTFQHVHNLSMQGVGESIFIMDICYV